MKRTGIFLALVMVAVGSCDSLMAADWGDLKVRFILEGQAPAPERLPGIPGNPPIFDEQLIVNSANNGIANVVVALYVARDEPTPPVHESYIANAEEIVRQDYVNSRLHPHITMLQAWQTLICRNLDPITHNANVNALRNPGANRLVPVNSSVAFSPATRENLPVPVSCNIHPWERGYLVIKDHPYMATSDNRGNLVITNVPAGVRSFQIWHEAAGLITPPKHQ